MTGGRSGPLARTGPWAISRLVMRLSPGPAAQQRKPPMSSITPVILVGGSGKRLWPLSRESMPKQFVPLLGKQSTFQQTCSARRRPRAVCTACDCHQRRLPLHGRAAGQGNRHGDRASWSSLSRRDLGPAMAAAAAYARNLGAKAVLALASDHLVIGAEEFLAGCREGLTAVQQGGIVTSASRRPSPRPTTATSGPAASVSARSRRSRPSSRSPMPRRRCATSRKGCRNSGNFLFPPDLLLSEMARFEPEMAAAAIEAVAKAKKTGSTVFLDADPSPRRRPSRSTTP